MFDRRTLRAESIFAAALAAVSFALNWAWEMAQMPAYAELAGRSWSETLAPCTAAAVGDVGLTFLVYGLMALAAGRFSWGGDREWNVYAAAALLGALVATAIEWRAAALGRWSYTGRMPVVPVLGVGLWPFRQLAVLTPLSVRLARWHSGRESRSRGGQVHDRAAERPGATAAGVSVGPHRPASAVPSGRG